MMFSSLIAWILASWLTLAQPLAVLPGLQGVFTGTPPENLGVSAGQLAPCPPSPNCVVSQGVEDDPKHAIAPLEYHRDRETAQAALVEVLGVIPRTTIATNEPGYIRVEFETRLMGFVDDGEFYFPEDEQLVQVRSASRLGESDLGLNRRRLEQIRLALQDLGL